MRLNKTGYVLLNTDNKSTIIVSNFKASMCAEKQTLTSTFKKWTSNYDNVSLKQAILMQVLKCYMLKTNL